MEVWYQKSGRLTFSLRNNHEEAVEQYRNSAFETPSPSEPVKRRLRLEDFLVRYLVRTQTLAAVSIWVTAEMHHQAKQIVVNFLGYDGFLKVRAVDKA
jgi:hypothetical protein